jgi:hypothetical protein
MVEAIGLLINPNFCNPAALIKSCLEMRLMVGYCVTICTVFYIQDEIKLLEHGTD